MSKRRAKGVSVSTHLTEYVISNALPASSSLGSVLVRLTWIIWKVKKVHKCLSTRSKVTKIADMNIRATNLIAIILHKNVFMGGKIILLLIIFVGLHFPNKSWALLCVSLNDNSRKGNRKKKKSWNGHKRVRNHTPQWQVICSNNITNAKKNDNMSKR